jgi:hypothetical protein
VSGGVLGWGVMSFVFGVIGLVIILIGSGLRYHQRRIRAGSVELLRGIQDEFDFGELNDSEGLEFYKKRKEEYEAEIRRYDSRKQKIKYAVGCWSLYLLGGAFLAVGSILYFQEDPKRTWEDLGKLMFIVLLVGGFNWQMSETKEKYEELYATIEELKERLKRVTNRHEGHIKFLENKFDGLKK